MRDLAKDQKETKILDTTVEQLLDRDLVISSVNNFATAAGMASSASGLSCLAICLANVYGLKEQFEG